VFVDASTRSALRALITQRGWRPSYAATGITQHTLERILAGDRRVLGTTAVALRLALAAQEPQP
jgi:hypothetical protein